MQFLKRDIQVDALFADFFAALAMLFMLLINTVSTLNVDPAGNQDNANTVVVEVSAHNKWSWLEYRELTAIDAVSKLPANTPVQLNVAATVDAATLFTNFQLLHQAGVTYSFTTVEGL
jgi:heme/copper-type cytochrome/quinol oxidase subunit 2